MKNWKNIFFIFPVMGYFLLESVIIAIFVSFVWKLVLYPVTNIPIGYLEWAAIIWIIKVIFFDVFKLISGLTAMNNQQQNSQNQES